MSTIRAYSTNTLNNSYGNSNS